RVAGPAEVSTGSGRVRLGQIDGNAVIKNSNGDSWIGEADGDLRVNAANGSISVDHANADVNARSANGDVRVGGITRGSASLKTSLGEIEVVWAAAGYQAMEVSGCLSRPRWNLLPRS